MDTDLRRRLAARADAKKASSALKRRLAAKAARTPPRSASGARAQSGKLASKMRARAAGKARQLDLGLDLSEPLPYEVFTQLCNPCGAGKWWLVRKGDAETDQCIGCGGPLDAKTELEKRPLPEQYDDRTEPYSRAEAEAKWGTPF